jgi:hypothetical protein
MLRLRSAGLYIQLPPSLRFRNKGWSTKHTRLLHHRHTSRKRPAHRLLLTSRKRPTHRLLLTSRKRPAHRLLLTSRKPPTPSRSLIRQPTIKIKRKRTRPKDNSGRYFPPHDWLSASGPALNAGYSVTVYLGCQGSFRTSCAYFPPEALHHELDEILQFDLA